MVVGSGLFFLPHALWDAYVGVYVAAMFACCRRAVAVNFLSAYSTNKDPEIRKKALFWLGQSHDPRALDLFEELLTKK